MNTRKQMIIIKGEIKTFEIKWCQYNKNTQKWDVEFNNGKKYAYAYSNLEWLKEPQILNPSMYRISREGRNFFNIEAIHVFNGKQDTYWHIYFSNGSERAYCERELKIEESCLNKDEAENVFHYIKQIANLSKIKNEKTGKRILIKGFEKIAFVGNDVALSKYLNPDLCQTNKGKEGYIPIFPFGCNNSQYKAVKNAMENQISIIQGPPGTGKTQTILNIIANILLEGKTVQIVSYNNAAIENVYEKLSSPQYNLGFLVATLGNLENKRKFIDTQDENYPDFTSWREKEHQGVLQKDIAEKSKQLEYVFEQQEKLAYLRQEKAQIMTEFTHCNHYIEETLPELIKIKTKKKFSAKHWLTLLAECKKISEKKQVVGILFKIKNIFQYGIKDKSFYKQNIAQIIASVQIMYYHEKQAELTKEIEKIENYLKDIDANLVDDLSNQSMAILKGKLERKYKNKGKRVIFEENDLWQNPYHVLEEYPIILSTTFSSRNSLNPNVVYDYLIMDEASQVDVITGALALSGAKNVVIVGDTKQLPNVVDKEIELKAQEIFHSFNIPEGYQYTKSFLQSILEVIPNVTQVLLREHYRCHPKIINFCNQKFYRGELIIMTEDKGEEDVLAVVKTVPGNHMRNHYSQRQIDVIQNEILPKYVENPEEIGIIAPYKNQVNAINKEIKDIDVATVHKFQGKEKDTIIISTVDDEISNFVDNPNLINVAVSRAKNKLMLVVTGNEQVKERNIIDLIDYIQYHNFTITDSKIYSVFDYLYKQYTEERKVYLQKHKKISEYDSENLMYSLIEDILSEDKYNCFDVVTHYPMNLLIKNTEQLKEREYQYVMNPATHIDFLIYNRISKKPMLAIEVDGYEYHKKDTIQYFRDLLKNHILELYEIPLLRFQTNGSGEKEKIEKMFNQFM